MPQLDIVTFFSQFFWLSLFFIGFYYLLYKYFLPSYSRSILFRDKFTSSSIEGSSLYMEEKGNIASSLSLLSISAIGFSKKGFTDSRKNTGNWHKDTYKNTNIVAWKNANLLYLETFGAKQATKSLSNNCISYVVGANLYLLGLSKICQNYNKNYLETSFVKSKTAPLLNLKGTDNLKSVSSSKDNEESSLTLMSKKGTNNKSNARASTKKSYKQKK